MPSEVIASSSTDASSNESSIFDKAGLLSLPTDDEIQACWELCRLHNNIGFWVIYLPTVWSIAMAYHANSHVTALDAVSRAAIYIPLCFGVKSLIMTIDDILDADVDGLVERTKARPLPRGAITHTRAWMFFYAQVIIGVFLSNFYLSSAARHISMFVWPIFIIYPTCKRWTNLAPIPLGIMFNVGIFMGWADLSDDGTLPWNILVPVYVGLCLWTITYETVYQHQDKVDDVKIGLHSPALLLGNSTVPICFATGVGFLSLLCYGLFVNGHGLLVYSGVSLAGVLILSRLLKTDIHNPQDCKDFFLATVPNGQIILAGFIVDALYYRLINGLPL